MCTQNHLFPVFSTSSYQSGARSAGTYNHRSAISWSKMPKGRLLSSFGPISLLVKVQALGKSRAVATPILNIEMLTRAVAL